MEFRLAAVTAALLYNYLRVDLYNTSPVPILFVRIFEYMCVRRWHLQLFGDDATKTLLLYFFPLFRGTKLPIKTALIVVVTRFCWNARYNMHRALGLATRYLRVSYSTQSQKPTSIIVIISVHDIQPRKSNNKYAFL